MKSEARLEACYSGEYIHDRGDDRVKIEIDVVTANILRKSLGPVPGLIAGVLGAHVCRVKDAHANFLAG